VSIGLCHAYLGNYEQAAASLEAVDPVVIHDDFSVVYDLARAYGVMGELEEAIEWFEKARTLLAQTTSVQHLDDLLNILYEIQAVEPARSIAVPTQILLYDAMRDYETQNIQAGVQKLRRALEMNPLDPVICHQLGIGLLHQGKCEEAIDMLERGLEFDPLHEQAQLALGDAYFHLGMYECALNAYKQTLHLNPHNIDAYHHLGLVYERQGEIDIAKGYWEDVLKADPHHAEAIRSLKRYDN
jgi:tetratricopeptide (TPR) repeat protein